VGNFTENLEGAELLKKQTIQLTTPEILGGKSNGTEILGKIFQSEICWYPSVQEILENAVLFITGLHILIKFNEICALLFIINN